MTHAHSIFERLLDKERKKERKNHVKTVFVWHYVIRLSERMQSTLTL